MTALGIVIASMVMAAGLTGILVVLVSRFDWLEDDGTDGR